MRYESIQADTLRKGDIIIHPMVLGRTVEVLDVDVGPHDVLVGYRMQNDPTHRYEFWTELGGRVMLVRYNG